MASPGPPLCVLGLLLCAAASLLAAAPVSTEKPIIGKEAGGSAPGARRAPLPRAPRGRRGCGGPRAGARRLPERTARSRAGRPSGGAETCLLLDGVTGL